MDFFQHLLLAFCIFSTSYAILTKPAESKTTIVENTKKADQIDAQASHSHQSYQGFSDNGIGDGFGSGSYGESYGGFNNYGGHDHHFHDHHHHDDHHNHHDNSYHKALAIKGLLVPLAGVALLGAAAAFVSNPILLQLGVISGSYVGRKRRDLESQETEARLDAQARLNQIQTLERFMSQVPKEQIFSQEKKLMANYLTCSGMNQENSCLERLACELRGPVANQMPQETNVMNIIANEIFSNDLVPAKTKKLIAEAAHLGKEGGDCLRYRCPELESLITSYNH